MSLSSYSYNAATLGGGEGSVSSTYNEPRAYTNILADLQVPFPSSSFIEYGQLFTDKYQTGACQADLGLGKQLIGGMEKFQKRQCALLQRQPFFFH